MDKVKAGQIQQLLIKVNEQTSYFFAYHPGLRGETELALGKRRLPIDDIRAWRKKGLQSSQLVTGKVRSGAVDIEFATSQKNVAGGVGNMQRLLRKLGVDDSISALKQAVAVIDLELDMTEEPEVGLDGDQARWERLGGLVETLVGDKTRLGGLVDAQGRRLTAINVGALRKRIADAQTALSEHTESGSESQAARGLEAMAVAQKDLSALMSAGGEAMKTASALKRELGEILVPTLASLKPSGADAAETQLNRIDVALDGVEQALQRNEEAVAAAERRAGSLSLGLAVIEELLAGMDQSGTMSPARRARLASAAALSKSSSDYSESLYNGMVGLTELSRQLAVEDDERCMEISVYLDRLADGAPHDLCAALDAVVEEARGEGTRLGEVLDTATAQVEVGLEFIDRNVEVLELVEDNAYGVKVALVEAMLGPLMAARADLGRLAL